MLLRPYTPDVVLKNFPLLDVELAQHYDRIYHTTTDFHVSPRYLFESGIKITFRDIFYYIDLLYDQNPKTVIDVGCGECVWKQWFPNIVGFDPNINEFSKQDFIDYFDLDFSQGHTQQYDCGMAINSLHFIQWGDIVNTIDMAMNIVKDKFLFTMNIEGIENSPKVTIVEQIQIFHQILQTTQYNLIMFDSPIHRGVPEADFKKYYVLNGTIRFILEHPIF